MQETRKRWLNLGIALASGISVGATAADAPSLAQSAPASMTADAGTVAGEGEGGGVAPVSLKTDDVAYLSRLGLIRGHLLVEYELYRHGHTAMAVTHMKHPGDELYMGLVPAINHRGGTLFDNAMSNLANVVSNDAGRDEVDRAYEALENGIKLAEKATAPQLKSSLFSIVELVRTAGEEYALGVEDGKLVNIHEYQDAYGFVEIAKRRLAELPAEVRAQSPQTVKQVETLVANLGDLWPALHAEGRSMATRHSCTAPPRVLKSPRWGFECSLALLLFFDWERAVSISSLPTSNPRF